MAFKDYRKHHQKEEDRLIVSRLYLKGWLQADIAAHLTEIRKYEISQQLVSYDLKRIRKRWIAEQIDNFDERMARELARIDQVERNAWEAWERSKQSRAITTRGKRAQKQEVVERQVKEEERPGDPRYLVIVMSCVQERCKLCGLYSPEKHEVKTLNDFERLIIERSKQRGLDPYPSQSTS